MNALAVLIFSQIHTMQSQTMRKLNPMNIPRMPPQSATREENGKASSSLYTWRNLLENVGRRIGLWYPSATYGSSVI